MNEQDLMSSIIQLIVDNPKTSIVSVLGLFLLLRTNKRQGPSQQAVDGEIKAKKQEFQHAVDQATEGIQDAKIKYDNAKRDARRNAKPLKRD